MSIHAYFSSSYAKAREKFLLAGADVGVSVASYHNPAATGPAGEELCTDVACLGPDNADKVFVVMSGTHGVEGFCGSGCQIGFLREGLYKELPPKTTLVLVHAINPYGFAHLRRVNEDNVDLNRNFIDHDQPPPLNPAYDKIHNLLVPPAWSGPSKTAADKALEAIITMHGPRAVQAALTGGQYSHPNGLFYGGQRPVWSNRIWRKILKEYIAGHRHVAFVDLHSGLGPYGYGEPIFRGRFDTVGYLRARDWYGESVTSSEDGTSTSTPIAGNTASALDHEISDAELTAITLEFGTLPPFEVLNTMRADHWLYAYGDPATPLGASIKTHMREAFYCDNDDWKQRVWDRAVEILRCGLVGLKKS